MKQSGWFSKENIDCTDCQVVHQTAKMDARYFQKMPRVESTSFCGGAGHFSLLELKATDFHQTNANIKLVKIIILQMELFTSKSQSRWGRSLPAAPMSWISGTVPAIFISFQKDCPHSSFVWNHSNGRDSYFVQLSTRPQHRDCQWQLWEVHHHSLQ